MQNLDSRLAFTPKFWRVSTQRDREGEKEKWSLPSQLPTHILHSSLISIAYLPYNNLLILLRADWLGSSLWLDTRIQGWSHSWAGHSARCFLFLKLLSFLSFLCESQWQFIVDGFASILKQACAGDCSWWNHVEPIEGGQYSQYWLEYDLNIISFYPRKLDGWIRRHVRFSGSRACPTVTHSIPQSCLAHNPLP